MSLPVYPTLPSFAFAVVKAPEFSTLEMKSPNGYEVAIAQTLNPIWHFTLLYDFLRDFPNGSFTAVSELRTLMGFFVWQSGMAGGFLFTDPSDCYVGPALTITSTPNTPMAQLQLVNDGAGNYYSPIQRTLDGNFYEDITDLNGAIAVYANGTLMTNGLGSGNYQVLGPGLALPGASYMGLYLKWYGPAPTGPITAQFNFYFRVRFESDSQDFEQFTAAANSLAVAGKSSGYWTIGGSEAQNGGGTLKLTTRRPTPL